MKDRALQLYRVQCSFDLGKVPRLPASPTHVQQKDCMVGASVGASLQSLKGVKEVLGVQLRCIPAAARVQGDHWQSKLPCFLSSNFLFEIWVVGASLQSWNEVEEVLGVQLGGVPAAAYVQGHHWQALLATVSGACSNGSCCCRALQVATLQLDLGCPPEGVYHAAQRVRIETCAYESMWAPCDTLTFPWGGVLQTREFSGVLAPFDSSRVAPCRILLQL